jgi:5-methylcytosine-specific restriction endonuclease McrA
MTAIQWTDQRPARRFRAAAASRIGVTLDEYDAKLTAGLKWCTGCKAWQSRSTFTKDRTRWDGLKSTCSNYPTRKTAGPSKAERRQRAARGESWCRGCQIWIPSGEVRSGVCKAHAAAEARANYKGMAAEKIRARVHARQRNLTPIPPWWQHEERERFDGLCAYGCGRPADTVDHIWPVSRGGKSAPGNLAPACRSCNSSKNNSDPAPWFERGYSAFPNAWADLVSLALTLNTDHWMETTLNG